MAENLLKQGPRNLLAQPAHQPRQDSSRTGISGAFRDVDDFVRGMADTMTFGLSDEIAAGMSSLTGVGTQQGGEGDYESNLTAERVRDESADPYVRGAGQITGALTSAVGAGRAGLSLLNAAKPTVKSMAARGAGEGAIYGGLYGAGSGEGGAQQRTEGAMWGALLGGLTGAGTGAVAGRLARGGKVAAPTSKELKRAGTASYDQAFGFGVVVKPDRYDSLVDDLYSTARQWGSSVKLDPKVYGALDEFDKLRGTAPSLKDIDVLRKTLKRAAGSNEKAERALANKLIDRLDDALGGMTPADVVSGNVAEATKALGAAREFWGRGSKGEVIDGLIRRAEKRSKQFSGSGMENALRTEFRQLSMNEKKMRLFSPAEQKAINLVAEGGTLTNAFRALGWLAPTGPIGGISGILSTGAFGPMGMALPAAGFVGRAGATVGTTRAANLASEIMRAGAAGPNVSQLTPLQLSALRAALISQSQQNVNALRPLLAPNTGQ